MLSGDYFFMIKLFSERFMFINKSYMAVASHIFDPKLDIFSASFSSRSEVYKFAGPKARVSHGSL